MRRAVAAVLVALLFLGPVAPAARGTTWGPAQVACPLCGHETELQEPMSYGSYVYGWPSRFQLVFWPSTDEQALWSCAGCKLTLFMWDFRDRVTPEHHERLRAVLAQAALPAQEGGYRRLPVLARLAVAETLYEVLGLDAERWCRFYRVVGYHAAKQGQPERAAAARRRALELVTPLLDDPAMAGMAKQNLVVAACLKRLLGDADGARQLLDAAAPLSIQGEDPDRASGMTAYLDELIAALRERLASGDLSDDGPEERRADRE